MNSLAPDDAASDLAGYDMVLSIPEKILNDQLSYLHDDGHIEQKIHQVQGEAAIEAVLEAPKICLHVSDEEKPGEWQCSLVLYFGKGSFRTSAGKSYETSAWRLAFGVDLDHTQVEHGHIDRIRVHRDVKESLKRIDPKAFLVRRLHLALRRGTVADHIDKNNTRVPGDLLPADLQSLCALVQAFLAPKMQNVENHFHLGFTPIRLGQDLQATSTSIDYSPTGLALSASVAYDAKGERQVVLNYLLMTEGRRLPDAPRALAPHHGTDGCYLRISQAQFMDRLFLKHLPRVMNKRAFERSSVQPGDTRWVSRYVLGTSRAGGVLDWWKNTFLCNLEESYHSTLTAKAQSNAQHGKHIEFRLSVNLRRSGTVVTSNDPGSDKRAFSSECEWNVAWTLRSDGYSLRMTTEGAPQLGPVLKPTKQEAWMQAVIDGYDSWVWTEWRRFHRVIKSYFFDFKSIFEFDSPGYPDWDPHGHRALKKFDQSSNISIIVPTKGVFTLGAPSLHNDPSSNTCQLLIPVKFDGV